ncbi:MAG: TetR/AcrR family transcriptional regulator [Rhodothermales bacterium]
MSSPRERLLETAALLFYKQGYLATGINQLIEEAGIAKASFYQHFPTKESLGAAYLEASHRRWNGLLEAYLDHLHDSREKILGLFDFLKTWKESAGYRGCSFLNMVAETPDLDHPLHAAALLHYDVFRARVRGLVEEFSGDYRPEANEEEKAEMTEGLVLLFQGATVSSQTYAATGPIEHARKTAARLLAC